MSDDETPQLEEVSDLAEAGPSTPRRQLDRPKVPLTLLTGYLGAGKSTLLDYVLKADHGYRIAVCMNDFGDTTDIEAKAMTLSNPKDGSQSSSFLSLPNGCLCCSFKDMGIAAIEEMVATLSAGGEVVDWVMVELTGVADPGPIARSFWENEEMGDLVLDGVVCVVDARNIEKQLAELGSHGEINEAQRQIAFSDLLLLNKLDLLPPPPPPPPPSSSPSSSPPTVQTLTDLLTSLNPTVKILPTTHSRIDLAELFHLRSFSSATSIKALQQPSHAHDHKSHHDTEVKTVMIPLPDLSPGGMQRLEGFLQGLLWEGKVLSPTGQAQTTAAAPEILRTKGYFVVTNNDEDRGGGKRKEYVIQGVREVFEVKELPEPEEEEEEEGEGAEGMGGKVVFIGRGVDERLRRALLEYLHHE